MEQFSPMKLHTIFNCYRIVLDSIYKTVKCYNALERKLTEKDKQKYYMYERLIN